MSAKSSSSKNQPPIVVASGSLKRTVPREPETKAAERTVEKSPAKTQTQKKRGRDPEEESSPETSEVESSSSEDEPQGFAALQRASPPEEEDSEMAEAPTTTSNETSDKEEGRVSTDPSPTKRKRKKTKLMNTETAPSATPSKPKGKQRVIEPPTDSPLPPSPPPLPSQEDLNTTTPTQKSKGKAIVIPSWLVNPDEVTVQEKTSWEWAPLKSCPIGGYDIPDICGKEVAKENQSWETAAFLGEYIRLMDANSSNQGVWATHLFSTAKRRITIVEEAVKELLGKGFLVAQVPNSVWALVYTEEGKPIAQNLMKKRAMLHIAGKRVVLFRSLVFPTYQNFRIREVRDHTKP